MPTRGKFDRVPGSSDAWLGVWDGGGWVGWDPLYPFFSFGVTIRKVDRKSAALAALDAVSSVSLGSGEEFDDLIGGVWDCQELRLGRMWWTIRPARSPSRR